MATGHISQCTRMKRPLMSGGVLPRAQRVTHTVPRAEKLKYSFKVTQHLVDDVFISSRFMSKKNLLSYHTRPLHVPALLSH